MDFDEYDYLEKMVENSEPLKSEERANGGDETGKIEDKERRQSSRHRSERSNDDRRSKRAKSREELHNREKERGSSRDRSSPKDGDRSDRDRQRGSRETRDRENDKSREERNSKGRERERDRDRGADRERDRGRGRREHGREHEKVREEREQEKDLERSHRSGSRSERTGNERDREKSRDREVKDRDREKSRDREVKDRDRERSRDIEVKDRDRERSRDRSVKDIDRERSRDREVKDRDRESIRDREIKDRDRERSRDREVKDRDREKSRDREVKDREKEREIREPERESRRYKDKKEGAVEPEVDPERDQRTVFAYQISLKADERDVYEFFSRAGKVRDVRLIMDRNSRRSKGVGYIEFYDAMSVPMAIALSGQPLLGQPVMVKPSEAEKNLVQSTSSVGVAGGTGAYAGSARKLYVGNLHYNMKEDQLRQVFESFGTVELVQLPTDETGNCKGFGFIQFARLEDARAAQSLNGQLEIAGRMMKVSAITDQSGMQEMGVNPGDFDDDDGGGLSLNARSRALLMQKLDRTGTAPSVVGPLGLPTNNSMGIASGVPLPMPPVTVPSAESVGVPSECLLLNNMFDPELEDEPDFDVDIKEDVQSESSKYGMLRHIYVEKNSAGFVYLRFENTDSAVKAQRALHGRWFAGKMITATFMLPQDYEAKFPESV